MAQTPVLDVLVSITGRLPGFGVVGRVAMQGQVDDVLYGLARAGARKHGNEYEKQGNGPPNHRSTIGHPAVESRGGSIVSKWSAPVKVSIPP